MPFLKRLGPVRQQLDDAHAAAALIIGTGTARAGRGRRGAGVRTLDTHGAAFEREAHDHAGPSVPGRVPRKLADDQQDGVLILRDDVPPGRQGRGEAAGGVYPALLGGNGDHAEPVHARTSTGQRRATGAVRGCPPDKGSTIGGGFAAVCERVTATPIRTFRAHIKRLMFCSFYALGPGPGRRQGRGDGPAALAAAEPAIRPAGGDSVVSPQPRTIVPSMEISL